MSGGKGFFVRVGIGEEENIGEVLIELALKMASHFQGSPEFWLNLTLPELFEWIGIANRIMKQSEERLRI